MCSPEVANHRGVVSASFVAYGGPAYDKTATVFISQSTAAGYHVGTAFVIQRTTLSIVILMVREWIIDSISERGV